MDRESRQQQFAFSFSNDIDILLGIDSEPYKALWKGEWRMNQKEKSKHRTLCIYKSMKI